MPAHPFNRLHYATKLVLLAAAYWLLARLSLAYFALYDGVNSLVWPASGLALAALLLGGRRYWPGIFLGTALAVAEQGHGAALTLALSAGNALTAVAARHALARCAGWRATLEGPRDLLLLGAVGAAAAALAATFGVASLRLAAVVTPAEALRAWFNWWQGDALGIVLVTPLVLVWRVPPRNGWRGMRLAEAVACFGLALLTALVVFAGWLPEFLGPIARGYLMFLFVVWSAVRFGLHGVTLLVAMTAFVALGGIVHDVGFFAGDFERTRLANFWAYTLTLASVGTALALLLRARRRSEEALFQERRLLAESQRAAGLGSWAIDLPSRQVHWSDGTYRIYGRPAGSAPPSDPEFLALHHPEDRPRIAAWVKECLAGRPMAVLEFRARADAGGWRWLQGVGGLERDGEGTPVRITGTFKDITDRKRAEEERDAREREFRLLAEAMPQIVWVARADGQVSYFNGRWTEYTGMSLEAGAGYGWTRPFHPEDEPRYRGLREAARQRREAFSVECRIRRADGAWRWWLIRGVPIFDAGGGLEKWFGTCTDVQDLKDAQAHIAAVAGEQDRRVERERWRISREVHDQIGQVFSAIKLIVESLPAGALPAAQAATLARAIELGIATTRKVTADLRPPLLDDLGLAAALRHFGQQVEQAGDLACIVDVIDEEALGADQRLALHRIAQEATGNALRHAGAGVIEITGRRDGGRYLFRITDDGRGFEPHDLSRGTMGLAIMRERAALLGGSCEIASGVGKGTVVAVSLNL